ncbi:MAG: hypothetical protein HDS06_09095 [Bacteroides sp.]|nr:hypothetical protein [Bacteroides sp.]
MANDDKERDTIYYKRQIGTLAKVLSQHNIKLDAEGNKIISETTVEKDDVTKLLGYNKDTTNDLNTLKEIYDKLRTVVDDNKYKMIRNKNEDKSSNDVSNNSVHEVSDEVEDFCKGVEVICGDIELSDTDKIKKILLYIKMTLEKANYDRLNRELSEANRTWREYGKMLSNFKPSSEEKDETE